MEKHIGQRRVVLLRGDITQVDVDAIVNAANSSLMGGGGVDGAIHRAGGPSIKEECRFYVEAHGPLPPGKAMVTAGGHLPASYVIHTVGPVWHGGTRGEAGTLASAYRESLRAAEELHLSTVAFPSISTGAYGYPVDKAADIAVRTVEDFLQNEAHAVNTVTFVLFDDATMRAYESAQGKVR